MLKKYTFTGDICHPGRVTTFAETEEEAVKKVDDGEFEIEDEQSDCLAFTDCGDPPEVEEADDAPAPADYSLWAEEIAQDVANGIAMFGRHVFDDKGPEAVMDIDKPADILRKVSAPTAGAHLEALSGINKDCKKAAAAILMQLDNMDEEWWNTCCAACPGVEYWVKNA